LLAGLCLVLLSGGARLVEGVCSTLVPPLCLLFVGLSLFVLIAAREAVPAAFEAIFKGAFRAESFGGGVLGVLTSKAVRYGVSRGLVSNEAGCGTAPIAHAGSNAQQAPTQGLLGMVEVFVDTILLCTLTALVILVSGVSGEGGVSLAINAFAAVCGAWAVPLLSFCVAAFALATLVCWSHYGVEALCYLCPRLKVSRVVSFAVALAALSGALVAPPLVWQLTDMVLGAMTVLNVLTLLFCRRIIIRETERFAGNKIPAVPSGQAGNWVLN
jgi:AGCS family alanine or glycine:cation symporter